MLYPADSSPAGQELRLRQEYFFTSASLQDIIRRHMQQYDDIRLLADKVAIQLNDTHPAIAVAELMRILVDHHGLGWDQSWEITKAAIGYTNHTLLPEALESWPVHLFEHVLPRHMQIIYGINAKLIADAQKRPDCTSDFLASVSLIDEHNGRRVTAEQFYARACDPARSVAVWLRMSRSTRASAWSRAGTLPATASSLNACRRSSPCIATRRCTAADCAGAASPSLTPCSRR